MYVDLKLLRLENDEMYQSKLAEILGITQSSLSRMERQFSDVNGLQYKKLCDYFGEEEVQKYVKENPLRNATTLPGKRRKLKPSDLGIGTPKEEVEQPDNVAVLIGVIKSQQEVIKSQQEEITKLNKQLLDLSQLSDWAKGLIEGNK